MKKVVQSNVILLVLITFFVFSLIALGFSPPPAVPNPQQAQSRPGIQVILRHDDRFNPFHVPAPRQAELGIQTANFTVNYNPPGRCLGTVTPWPQAAQDAFNFAVDVWASLLNSSQTIEVDACWRSDLPPGVLGSAAPVSIYADFPNAQPSTWYPAALANTLANSDLDGGSDAEISANFSSTFDWHFDPNTTTDPSKVDFPSVVLHELAHGLGFFGFGWVSSGTGTVKYCFPDPDCFPGIYDQFTEDGNGLSLLNDYADNSPQLANALTGGFGGVFFDGTNADAANGGNPVKLYSPGIWNPGSSYSHLDEIFNNTPNALMTYSLANGESEHSPGPVALGMLIDMGWTANLRPDLRIIKSVVGTSSPAPGDPISFTLDIANIGVATATNVVVTDTLSTDIQAPSWNASPSLSGIAVQGGTYVWDLPDLAAGASGTITIEGTINPGLSLGFTIPNTATISGNELELNDSNNSSTVVIGESKIYLPIIQKSGGSSSGPTPGFWASGVGDEFYVTPGSANVDNFAIYVSVPGTQPGCGGVWKITHFPLEPIINDQFSFSGSFYASGTFNSATTASGIDGLSFFPLPTCSISGGPWTWNATWQNNSQPTIVTGTVVEPEAVVESTTRRGKSITTVTPMKITP